MTKSMALETIKTAEFALNVGAGICVFIIVLLWITEFNRNYLTKIINKKYGTNPDKVDKLITLIQDMLVCVVVCTTVKTVHTLAVLTN